MSASEPENGGRALKDSWSLLVRLDQQKAAAVANDSGIDEGTLSKFRNGLAGGKLSAHQLYALMKALNLKIVDVNARCITPDAFKILTEHPEFAGKVLRAQPKLIFED